MFWTEIHEADSSGSSISISPLIVLVAFIVFSPLSSAALILDLQRVSDDTVIISGTGAITDSNYLAGMDLHKVSSRGNSGTADSITGDFQVGVGNRGYQVYIYVNSDPGELRLGFQRGVVIGDVVAGASSISLDVETWAS